MFYYVAYFSVRLNVNSLMPKVMAIMWLLSLFQSPHVRGFHVDSYVGELVMLMAPMATAFRKPHVVVSFNELIAGSANNFRFDVVFLWPER